MNGFSHLDRAQLAAADAAVEWFWRVLGIRRRMILTMALVGQFLTTGAAQWIVKGRADPFTLVIGLLVFVYFQRNEARFAANPALQRALILASRKSPAASLMRGFVWGLAVLSLAFRTRSSATSLQVASICFFLAFVIGGFAPPSVGPRKRNPRYSRLARAAAITPLNGF